MLDLRRLLGWQPDIELTEDDEYRRPPRVLRGDLELEPQSGVGEVYESAPLPRWTTEPPTHEGLFFVRAPRGPLKIAEVFRAKDSRLHLRWTDFGPFPVPRAGLEWSDRAIPKPVEPRDAA